jgi:Ethanolamine utilization protein EutJ (predicted chaperonin)
LRGVAREIQVRVQTAFVKTKLWFALAQCSSHAIEGISRHQMSIAVDDHRHPLWIEPLSLTPLLSAYKIPAIWMQAQGSATLKKK